LSFDSSLGEVEVFPVGHGSLRIEVNGLVIHVDPWSEVADYSMQPDADLVLVTHTHQDHLDPAALEQVAAEDTVFVMDANSAAEFGGEATALANGETFEFQGIVVTAVPAYNVARTRDDGSPYHARGAFNGYLLGIGDLRVHVTGDTECVPELADLGEVDVSFLPINLPFTMPPEEAAECYRTIAPTVAVPYHQGESDPQVVADLLADTEIDVRVLELP
jgi:L-ascorbate metabolism protein UlaG (beta-lactamase superfamily)